MCLYNTDDATFPPLSQTFRTDRRTDKGKSKFQTYAIKVGGGGIKCSVIDDFKVQKCIS